MPAPESGALFERKYEVEGSAIELLAEVEIAGKSLHLRDIAIFPTGPERTAVGAAAVLSALRSELLPEVRSWGFTTLRITGIRLSGARPGRRVDVRIDLTESAW